MLGLAPDALARGVTAVSAGNHAIATAWAARELRHPREGGHVGQRQSGSGRQGARGYGAELVMVPDVAEAFATAERIGREEGRAFVHPFEGPLTARGTGTVGLEWLEQSPGLDAVLVPVGGGGLLAGIACAVKQLRPDCLVIGVEPAGRRQHVAQLRRRAARSGWSGSRPSPTAWAPPMRCPTASACAVASSTRSCGSRTTPWSTPCAWRSTR